MKRPGFITTEKQADASCLVLDKEGKIGEALAEKLSQEFLVVYVGRKSKIFKTTERLVYIPYVSKFPSIPDYRYSLTFIVDDRTITKNFLQKVTKKIEVDGGQLIFTVQRKDLGKNYLPKLLLNDSRWIKTVILGDVVEKDLHANRLIHDALENGRVRIESDGLRSTYPLFLEDAIFGILEAVFGLHDAYSIFYLFPKYPPTQISLARMIQKANPEVKIDFIKSKKQKEQKIFLPSRGKYLLEDNYSLQNRIKSIFLKKEFTGLEEKNYKRLHSYKDNFNPFPLAVLLGLVFLLLLPLFMTWFFSFVGFKSLEGAKESFTAGNLSKAQREGEFSRIYFKIAKTASLALVTQAKIIGKEQQVEPIVKGVNTGENESLAEIYLAEAFKSFVKVFQGKSKDANNDFASFSNMLRNSVLFLQKAGSKDWLLQDFGYLIKIGANATDILPEIFGFDREKTYLVLFQDNLELRPTGGLINSYGLLTIEEGRIKKFSMHDVESLDRRLKGHIEPPYPIRRHLGVKHWYFRDSNFDIDFAKSASKSAFFLNAITNIEADGVFAIDTSFIKKIVSLMGPIYIAEYKKEVNENNFYEIFLSNSKRDFIRALFNTILAKGSLEKSFYAPLSKIVSDSLVEKHFLFAFANKSIQDFFTVNNWSSALWKDRRLHKNGVISDFIGINEANLGSSKTNYSIKRTVGSDIIIDDKGTVSATLSVYYNNYDNKKRFKGDYKNYLRIALLEKAQLLSITIDGKPQKIIDAVLDPQIYESDKNVLPNTLEVEKTVEDGKSFFGFLVNVVSGKKQKIDIQYSLPQAPFVDKHSFSYILRYFKQPGTEEYPFKISISYPSAFRLITVPQNSREENGKLSLAKNINSDEQILVRFAKK